MCRPFNLYIHRIIFLDWSTKSRLVHPTSSPALEILTSMSSLLGCFHCHGCFYLQLVPDASRIKLCNHPGGGGLLARNDSNCFRGCWTIGQDCKGGWQQKITTIYWLLVSMKESRRCSQKQRLKAWMWHVPICIPPNQPNPIKSIAGAFNNPSS